MTQGQIISIAAYFIIGLLIAELSRQFQKKSQQDPMIWPVYLLLAIFWWIPVIMGIRLALKRSSKQGEVPTKH